MTLAPPRRAHAGENPATAAAAIIFFYVLPRSQQLQAEIGALKAGEGRRGAGVRCLVSVPPQTPRLNERILHALGQFSQLFYFTG